MSSVDISSPFDPSVIGRTYTGPSFTVTSDAIKTYAAATNDPTVTAVAGQFAPPVFSLVPLRPVLREMLSATTPLYEQLKSLHGEQDIFFVSPLESGMTVTPYGSVVGIRRRRTGTAVILNLQTRNDDGLLVNEHFTTLYFAGVDCGELESGRDAPEHRLPPEVAADEPIARITTPTDVDQPTRYSQASGDTGAYHLDLQAALNAGLPGIIMHGMCTFAMVGSAVLGEVARGDVTRLRRLGVRFSHPVIPGELLDTRVWRLPTDRGENYGFETLNPAGSRVVSHGRAELA